MDSSKHGSQEQETAIKARKQLLFEVEEAKLSSEDQKPFSEFLRTTPAAPLSLGVKAALAAAGAVAGLLLILALVRGGRRDRMAQPPNPPSSSERATATGSSPGKAQPAAKGEKAVK